MKIYFQNDYTIPDVKVLLDSDPAPEGYFIYEGEDQIKTWGNQGVKAVGNFKCFRDVMCLRSILKELIQDKCGSDYASFENNLNSMEIQIALKYIPTKIIQNRGYSFFSDQCGGVIFAEIIIKDYLQMAITGRKKRYQAFINYAYSNLEHKSVLKAEKRVRENQLNDQFIERGVLKLKDDHVPGILDWLKGEVDTDFENDSLLGSLNSGVYKLNDDTITNADFIDNCILILEKGIY